MIKEDIIHHREPEAFENIKKGIKRIEIRVYDEKRQRIKLGDIIKIINKQDKSKIFFVKVVGLSRFMIFKGLYNVFEDRIKDFMKKKFYQ